MSSSSMLHQMFSYQAWANKQFLLTIDQHFGNREIDEAESVTRLMSHCLVVNKIFAAHLEGRPHGYGKSNVAGAMGIKALGDEMEEVDRWYLNYVSAITPSLLSEAIHFEFTDGDRGCMTREEILIHVVTHGGYHRGEVGRLLMQADPTIPLPWDTFAVYLHQATPDRRARG